MIPPPRVATQADYTNHAHGPYVDPYGLNAFGGGGGDVTKAGNNAFTGINTFAGATGTPANALAALAIDVTKGLNTKTIAVDSTFTFSGTPATANTWFSLYLINSDSSNHVVTIPSSFSQNGQATITTFNILAGGQEFLTWRYDGSAYEVFGVPSAGYSAEQTIASATTTDIGASASVNVSISGTTTITGLGTVAAGTFRQGRFTGALIFTHNATSLIIPGAANITTSAGDRFGAYSLGSGNWVILWYVAASGLAPAPGVPQNSQSAAYTTVMTDNGKSIDHPSGDANARTYTIDSNANVPYPIGACIMFTNMTSQAVTIAITSDTMNLASAGTTGSRTLAQYGVAVARKVASTVWLISGTGLT